MGRKYQQPQKEKDQKLCYMINPVEEVDEGRFIFKPGISNKNPEQIYAEISVSTQQDGTGICTPVSYTHLDVYKRQMWLCP